MARIVHDFKLAKREQRLRLEPRKKPYWMTLNEGEHLGYYRGARVGKWVARYRRPGGGPKVYYQETTIAEADDYSDADGEVVLNFRQAQEAARKWFARPERSGERRTGPYTVSNALDDYVAASDAKDLMNTKRRIEAVIRPELGAIELAQLTTRAIEDWKSRLVSTPARLRTAKGADQNYRELADTPEARRKRQASVNRTLTILKAALNMAYRREKVASDNAWRRVKPFPKADAPKLRYLSDDEARRLVNACEGTFRAMVQAALLTGARYSELANLEVRDFDVQAHTLWLRDTKAKKPRAVYLEAEGVQLFEQMTNGKSSGDAIFVKDNGKRWAHAHQARPFAAACKAAKLEPTGFHDLRRTYGARLALKGVPMAVIAEAMGHADERITRRHYAHLSPSYVSDTVRAAVSGLGIVAKGNVVRLAKGKS